MLANYSALFDRLLVLAGLVLVIIGPVMFIRSKSPHCEQRRTP